MTSQDLDNIDWSFLREQEPWQFGQQNVTAAESDSASSQSLSTRNSRGTSSRARNWCFTLNNPSEEELYNLHTILPQAREFRFIVFQLEQGLDGATPHVQGYIEFNCQLRLNAAKRLISQRAHLEVRRGSQQQAIAYCEKQETRLEGPWRYGEPQEGRQGQRSDLLALKSALDEGSTDLQLWEEFFPTMMRYYKGVAQYQILKRDQRRWKSKVYVLVGEPGTGKSKWALDNFPNAYWKQRGNWWDGYHHDDVVLDDFYGWLPFDTLLRLLDRYPLLVETKGGQASFIAKNIVITSNALPKEWYQNVRNYSALARRIDVVMKFTGENQFIEININELD